jgi:hypothetical protein
MKNRKAQSRMDVSTSALTNIDVAAQQLRNEPDSKYQWSNISAQLKADALNRELADEHQHGLLFTTAVDEYLRVEDGAKRGALPVRAKWELLKPVFAGVRVADVDDRLLKAAEQHRSLTFVQNVLRFARQQQRDRNPQRVPTPTDYSTPNRLREAWIDWIDLTLKPTAFVTIDMPHATLDDDLRTGRVPRSPHFYFPLLARRAERILWGMSAMRVHDRFDRCFWFGVHETEPYLHFHLLLWIPERPMRVEKETGLMSTAERLARVHAALVQASAVTPEAFATGDSLREHLRENIQVKPYGRHHAEYLVGKLARAGEFKSLPAREVVGVVFVR